MSKSPLSRRMSGLTILEVLVVAAIVGVLVTSLIPAITAARARAGAATCSGNLHGINNSLGAYAADYSAYTPVTLPTDAGDWYPDYRWSSPLNAGVSSNGIWGIRSCSIPNVTQGWPPNPANPGHYNEALGLGVLVARDYTTINHMYCSATRNDGFLTDGDGFPAWKRRQFFGLALTYWPSSSTYDGLDWLSANGTGVYGDNTNYLLPATYSYRGGDWAKDIVAGNLSRNTSASSGFVYSKVEYCRTTTPGYTQRGQVIDYRGYLHAPLTGGNVLWGDGSVNFWNEPGSFNAYTTNGVGPGDIWAGWPAWGLFASYLFREADIARGM